MVNENKLMNYRENMKHNSRKRHKSLKTSYEDTKKHSRNRPELQQSSITPNGTVLFALLLLSVAQVGTSWPQDDAPSKEFILVPSDLLNDKIDNNLPAGPTDSHNTMNLGDDARFARSKRRRGDEAPLLSGDRSRPKTSTKLVGQERGSGSAIPAASPNFEAAFQGECNQNNESASSSNPCEHICLDLHDGTYECSCFYGFTLAVDGYSCAKLPQVAPQLPQPHFESAEMATLSSGAAPSTAKDKKRHDAFAAIGEHVAAGRAPGAPNEHHHDERERTFSPPHEEQPNRKLGNSMMGENNNSNNSNSSSSSRDRDNNNNNDDRQRHQEGQRRANLLGTVKEDKENSHSNEINKQQLSQEGSFGGEKATSGLAWHATGERRKAKQRRGRRRGANAEEEWRRGAFGGHRHGLVDDNEGTATRPPNKWPKYEVHSTAPASTGWSEAGAELGREQDSNETGVWLGDASWAEADTRADTDEPDAEVESIMLANDQLAGKLEQTIGGEAQDSIGARQLDYDLGLLGRLVGETIIRLPLEQDYERDERAEKSGAA